MQSVLSPQGALVSLAPANKGPRHLKYEHYKSVELLPYVERPIPPLHKRRPCNQVGAWGETPCKNFLSPQKFSVPKMCWAWLKTIGHSLRNLDPYQKTLRHPFEDFLATVLRTIWGNRLETVSHELQGAGQKAIMINIQTKMEINCSR